VFRRFIIFFPMLSCALGLTTLALWVGEPDSSRELTLGFPTRAPVEYLIALFNGNVWCGRFTSHKGYGQWNLTFRTDYRYSAGFYCMVMMDDVGREWPHLGRFGLASHSGRPADEAFSAGCILEFPAWLLIGILLLPLSVQGWQFFVKRARRRGNRCIMCGYDLRATTRRCPECETAPAKAVATAAVTDPSTKC
jgi:hypothetical protein